MSLNIRAHHRHMPWVSALAMQHRTSPTDLLLVGSTNAPHQEQDKGPGDQSTPEDITKAKEAVAAAMHAIRESS